MYKIEILSDEPKQKFTVQLDSGERVVFHFEYRPNQIGWFFSFEYNDEKYQNIRLTTSYNILRAYRNWLPFGLRCDTLDDEEPIDLDDFATKYATVYFLNSKDVQAIEGNYYQR